MGVPFLFLERIDSSVCQYESSTNKMYPSVMIISLYDIE